MSQRNVLVRTTAAYTQPSVSGTVEVRVNDVQDLSRADMVFVSGGGYYMVYAVPDARSLMLFNLSGGNQPPGTVVGEGAVIQRHSQEAPLTSDALNTICAGVGAPTSSVGVPGDYYMNMSPPTLYGPKSFREWPTSGVSLVGATGVTGRMLLRGTATPTATGVENDFYVKTNDLTVWGPKTSEGSWTTAVSLVGGTGVTGVTGRMLLAGAGTPDATGVENDFYVRTDDRTIWGPKTSEGSWTTAVSLVGGTGVTGVTGRMLLAGAGTPTAMGVENDFYVDTTSQTMWGPKMSDGTWTTGVSLVGGTGVTGVTGRMLLAGAGDPVAGTGVTNDFYVRTDDRTIWGPKTSQGWPATGMSLVGGTGVTGVTGRMLLAGAGTPTATGVENDFYVKTNDRTIWGPKTSQGWPATGMSLVGGTGVTGVTGVNVLQTHKNPTEESGFGRVGDYAVDKSVWDLWGPKVSGSDWTTRVRLRGATGVTGSAGRSMLSGTSEASGGSNGDVYIDTASRTLYGPKANGVWDTGVPLKGQQGVTGVKGRSIHSGTETPAADLGNTGDHYYNTSNRFLYGPKTSGWLSPYVFIGETGVTGATGINLRSGSGVPLSGLGINGEFYIDTTNKTIYNPKTGGAWPTPSLSLEDYNGRPHTLFYNTENNSSLVTLNPLTFNYRDLHITVFVSPGFGKSFDLHANFSINLMIGRRVSLMLARGSSNNMVEVTGPDGILYQMINGEGWSKIIDFACGVNSTGGPYWRLVQSTSNA